MEGWCDVPSFLSNADISEVFRRPPGYFQPLISPVRPHTGVYTVTRGQVTLRVVAEKKGDEPEHEWLNRAKAAYCSEIQHVSRIVVSSAVITLTPIGDYSIQFMNDIVWPRDAIAAVAIIVVTDTIAEEDLLSSRLASRSEDCERLLLRFTESLAHCSVGSESYFERAAVASVLAKLSLCTDAVEFSVGEAVSIALDAGITVDDMDTSCIASKYPVCTEVSSLYYDSKRHELTSMCSCPYSCTSKLQHLCHLLVGLLQCNRRDLANNTLNEFVYAMSSHTALQHLSVSLQVAALQQWLRRVRNMSQHAAKDSLMECLRLCKEMDLSPKPHNIAVGGMSGHGKRIVAKLLAGAVAGALGAIVIKSESERKGMISPAKPVMDAMYTFESTEAVYANMNKLAVSIVKDTGLTVVLDGTFLKSKRRNNAKKAALEHGVPFIGVWVTQESRIAPPKLSSGSSTDSDTGLHVYNKSDVVGSNDWIPVAGIETDAHPAFEVAEALKHRVISALVRADGGLASDVFML